MPITVEIPDIGSIEFPDDMSEDEILEVLKTEPWSKNTPEEPASNLQETPQGLTMETGRREHVFPTAGDVAAIGTEALTAARGALLSPADEAAKAAGRLIAAPGQAAIGALADLGENILNPNEGYHTENIQTVLNNPLVDTPPRLSEEQLQEVSPGVFEPIPREMIPGVGQTHLPATEAIRHAPLAIRIPGEMAQGLVGSVPQLAATAALAPVTGPAVAAGAIFGLTPEGFDPRAAAVAMALPGAGKITGELVEALATKLGVTSEAALNILHRAGGATGAAGLVAADQAERIARMPEEERKDAAISAIASVLSMAPLGAMGERVPLAAKEKGQINASSIQKTTEVHGNVRESSGRSEGQMPANESGQGVQPSRPIEEAANAKGGQARVLLSPEEAKYLESEREGMDTAVEVAETLPSGEPFAGQIATIDRANNKILVNPREFSSWLSNIPEARRGEAVRSMLSEERIHLATDDASAKAYWNTLTAAEKAIARRRYTGTFSGKETSSGMPVNISDTGFGHEALRFRMQQLARMTPREIAEAVGREKWTLQGLTAVESAIRGIRGLLKTEASGTAKAILDRVQENLATAKFIASGGQPAALLKGYEVDPSKYKDDEIQLSVFKFGVPGIPDGIQADAIKGGKNEWSSNPNDLKKAGFDIPGTKELLAILPAGKYKLSEIRAMLPKEGETRFYQGAGSPDGGGSAGAFWTRNVERAATYGESLKYVDVPADVAAAAEAAAKKAGSGTAGDAVLPNDWAKKAKDGEQLLQKVHQLEPAALNKKARPKEPEFFLPPLKSGEVVERPGATDLGAPRAPRTGPMTRPEIELAASDAMSRLAQQLQSSVDAGEAAKLPNFRRFVAEIQGQHPELKAKDLSAFFDQAIMDLLAKASGRTLGAMRKAAGIEGKYGDRAIADAPGSEKPTDTSKDARRLRNAQQGYRAKVMSRIYQKMVKSVGEVFDLNRKAITEDDVSFGSPKDFVEIQSFDLKHPDALAATLVEGARESGQAVSATKRLTLLVNKKNGQAHLVSTYADGRRGTVLREPGMNVTSKLKTILPRFRPVASILLDAPVRDFHQKFDSLSDFENKLGQGIRSRAGASQFSIPGGAEGEFTQSPSGGKMAVPGTLQEKPGSLETGKELTDNEAGTILGHIIDEAGKFEGPEDVQLSLAALQEAAKENRLQPIDRVALSAYRKAAAELERRNPEISREDLIDQLTKTIYENHQAAKTGDEFIARTLESFTSPAREPVISQDTGNTATATEAGTGRELSQLRDVAPTTVRPEQLPPDYVAPEKKPAPAIPTASLEGPAALNKKAIGAANQKADAATRQVITDFIHDPAKAFSDYYAGWMSDNIRRNGKVFAAQGADAANAIIDRAKRIYGDNSDVIDAAKIATGGSTKVKVIGQIPSPSRIMATRWLSQFSRKWTENAATARFVDAIEGKAKNVPAYVASVVRLADDANFRAGQIVEPVSPGFKAGHKFERHLTSVGYDWLQAGLENPATQEWYRGLLAANRGYRGVVRRFFKGMHEELTKEVPDVTRIDKVVQDFRREVPNVVTHVRTRFGWQEVVHTQPFNYIENTMQRAAHVRAFREIFPADENGKAKFNLLNDQVLKELPPQYRQDWVALIKTLQGRPTDSFNLSGWLAPGKAWPEAVRAFNQTWVSLTARRVLTGQMITQIPETLVGGTVKNFGMMNAIRGMLKLPEYWDTAETQGQVNAAIYDWSFDANSPIRSLFRMAGNTISKTFATNLLNELQGRQNAVTAAVVAERIRDGKLTKWEKRRLPETMRMMHFTPEETAKIMAGDANMIGQMLRRAPSWLSTENRHMAEGSRASANRLLSSLFRFQTYPMMKLNNLRQVLNRVADPNVSRGTALEGLGRELFFTGLQGAGYTLLAAYVFRGGSAGANIKLHEAKDEPLRFIGESILAAMGGPLYMVYQGVRSHGVLGIGEQFANLLFPYTVGRDLQDMFQGNGQYRDKDWFDRISQHLMQKTPGIRLVNSALALTGLANENKPLEESIAAFHRWSRDTYGTTEFNSNLKLDERKDFRAAMKRGEAALREGDHIGFQRAMMEATLAAEKIPPTEKSDKTPEQRIKASLEQRKILKNQSGAALSDAEMQALRDRIGDEAVNRLMGYDAMLDSLAEGFSE